MVIKVDQEGEKLVQQLADIALKSQGLQGLQLVDKIRSSLVREEVKSDETSKETPKMEKVKK